MITAQELISRGFVEEEYSSGKGFKKGDMWDDREGGCIWVRLSDDKITISTTDLGDNMDGRNYSLKFKGKCPNIEIFDLILGLTNAIV